VNERCVARPAAAFAPGSNFRWGAATSLSLRRQHPAALDVSPIVTLYTRLFAVPFLTAKNNYVSISLTIRQPTV
jgi:hypothetical protein